MPIKRDPKIEGDPYLKPSTYNACLIILIKRDPKIEGNPLYIN